MEENNFIYVIKVFRWEKMKYLTTSFDDIIGESIKHKYLISHAFPFSGLFFLSLMVNVSARLPWISYLDETHNNPVRISYTLWWFVKYMREIWMSKNSEINHVSSNEFSHFSSILLSENFNLVQYFILRAWESNFRLKAYSLFSLVSNSLSSSLSLSYFHDKNHLVKRNLKNSVCSQLLPTIRLFYITSTS